MTRLIGNPEDRSGDSDRIDRLEMRLSEQARTIDDLDSAVTAQWAEIDALRRRLDGCLARLSEAERRLPDEPDGPPPHF